jgi:hypothetical protein
MTDVDPAIVTVCFLLEELWEILQQQQENIVKINSIKTRVILGMQTIPLRLLSGVV